MQPVEDFMREFFRARITEEQSYQENRAPFRRKFYCDEGGKDSHLQILAMFQSEEIVSVAGSASEAIVITVHKNPFYKTSAQMHRKRYHVKAAGEGWLIQFVEAECPLCLGLGDRSCAYCKGKLWRREGLTAEEREREDKGNPPPSPPEG